MRRLVIASAIVTFAATSRADEPRRFEVGAGLGYAFPAASAASGARLSDSTFGLVPLDIDVAYRFTEKFAIAVSGRYGIGIPTLCKSASDCESSLGSDVALGVRARFFLPTFGRLEPRVDLGLGYEWYASRVTDSGVTSTHTYGGPIFLSLEAMAPFRLSKLVTLGPVLATSLGVFTSESLETPSGTYDGPHGRAVHSWLSLGGRVAFSF